MEITLELDLIITEEILSELIKLQQTRVGDNPITLRNLLADKIRELTWRRIRVQKMLKKGKK